MLKLSQLKVWLEIIKLSQNKINLIFLSKKKIKKKLKMNKMKKIQMNKTKMKKKMIIKEKDKMDLHNYNNKLKKKFLFLLELKAKKDILDI